MRSFYKIEADDQEFYHPAELSMIQFGTQSQFKDKNRVNK